MGYPKVKALEKLKSLGMNVHTYKVCKDTNEILSAYHELGGVCTIRTDSNEETGGKLLPFFIANRVSDAELREMVSGLDSGLLAIVANGLRHDSDMRCNIVYRIDKGLNFICEFNREKIPLRRMYTPDKLNSISGNLNEGIRDWRKRLAKEEKYRVDLREIREVLLYELEKVVDKNGLYNRYVEMTIYNRPVGEFEQDRVYWEYI